MKKVLMYGAIGGIALYLYLQLQKKKKAVPSQTADVKQDTSGSAIPSGTGGIKPPKPVPTKTTVPPMTLTTPKGEGDGVSVKQDAPTPPAPTVEPVVIPPPKPVYGGIKPPKPVPVVTTPIDKIITKPLPTKPIYGGIKPPKPVPTKPPKLITIKEPKKHILIPKFGDPIGKLSEDELGRPVDRNTGRPVGMPTPQLPPRPVVTKPLPSKPVYGGIKPPKPVVTKPLPNKPVIKKPPVVITPIDRIIRPLPPKPVYGGIKPPKPVVTKPLPTKPVKTKPIVPPMATITPKGFGNAVSVKNDTPTPPAPTVEPVYGGIKPPKPVVTKPLPTKPILNKKLDVSDFTIPRVSMKRPIQLKLR